jgi:predicted permease
MKTLFGFFKANKLANTTIYVLMSLLSFAQNVAPTPEEKAKDNSVGFIIIASILGVGIFGYVVVTLIERYNKKHKKNVDPAVRQRFNSRHHRRNHHKPV